jgi:hypothetical protein
MIRKNGSLARSKAEIELAFLAVITGIVTFAATNVDDLFILRLFFSQTDAAFP